MADVYNLSNPFDIATLPDPVNNSALQSYSNIGSGLGDIGSSILGGVVAFGQSWLGYQQSKIDSKRTQSLQEQELALRAQQQGLDFSGWSNIIIIALIGIAGLFIITKLTK